MQTTPAGAGVVGVAGMAIGGAGSAGAGSVMADAGTGGTTGAAVGAVGGAGAGAAGTGAAMPPASVTCADPPAGTPDSAARALSIVNQLRVAAGAGCMSSVPTLVASARAHCDYVTVHRDDPSCYSGGHGEIASCSGFTGESVQSREIAAGYPQALAYTEVFTSYGDDPELAVPSWIDTVFHRIPLLDPWTVDMGYGGSPDCDVIDLGRGMSTAASDTIVLYPYDGQTDVPPAWSGLEAPAPPAPAGGWPSSYPISLYAQALSVTEHVLTKDGDATPIEHVWLDAKSPEVSAGLKGYFKNTAFLYGAAFELSTTYRVKIVGSHTGGALNVEWTFTTGSKRPFGT